MSYKCEKNFISQYAYIDGKSIHINEYKNYLDRKNDLFCCHGHLLIGVRNVKSRKAYFRHKNLADTVDNKMNKWHSEWQSEFEITEFIFNKLDSQIKLRRADAYIQLQNLIIEFQHSSISKEEVDNRRHDYNLHDMNIIWVLDGNPYIETTKLHNGRIFLTFNTTWLYKSFTSYDIVYIDYECEIYKIYPTHIKNKMIDVAKPYDKINFIQMIKVNDNELYNIDIPDQCTLYINQLGAGNGKTYGIIQNLQSDDFSHYKQYVIVTKQHSAKEIIYREFKEQYDNGDLKYITELRILNASTIQTDKKYILSYINNKTQSECQIVISTIDSMVYNLGNKNSNGVDLFTSIIQSIIDGYVESNDINILSYKGGVNVRLNKDICIIIDETQDLPENYASALIKIMRGRYIDLYIVGDKLQSIQYEHNAFNYFEKDFSYINKICTVPINICRRFVNQKLVNFCNSVVAFDDYKLPKIEPYRFEEETSSTLEFINVDDCRRVIKKLNGNTEKIMEKYKSEVENNNCQPNDFLFVTPFTKNNRLVESIELAINHYWINRNGDTEYIRYAIFHKSEEGTSIDTNLSINTTRIVSIHSAKGDGRKIVFVIGCDEISLKRFSRGRINLVYESLFHVAITRMKKKLYFAYIANNDNIYQRIENFAIDNDIHIKPSLICCDIKYKDIITTDTNDDTFSILKKKVMTFCNFDDCINGEERKIIDMQHHNIRVFCMHILFWLKVINKNEQIKNQLLKIFDKIRCANIQICTSWKDYNDLLKRNEAYNNIKNKKNREKRFIPILSYNTNESRYKIYHTIIMENIKSIIKKLDQILKLNNVYLCPYESIILYYMYNVVEYGFRSHDLNITELYEITHIYYNSFSHNIDMHNNCECKKIFPNNNNGILYNYLLTHYEQISIVNNEYDKFLNDNPNMTILLSHSITYKGTNDNFEIKKQFCIGYNNDIFYIINIHPSFNNLNHNKFFVESMYDVHLLQNRLSSKDNQKIDGKLIKTVLFSCDTNRHYIFDWNNNGIDYIRINEFYFKYRIRKFMRNLFLSQVKNYHFIILSEYDKLTREQPIEKIKKLCDKFDGITEQKDVKKKKNKIIVNYLRGVKTRISDAIKKRLDTNEIITEYILNYDSFNVYMKDEISEMIDDYLNWTYENKQLYMSDKKENNKQSDDIIT